MSLEEAQEILDQVHLIDQKTTIRSSSVRSAGFVAASVRQSRADERAAKLNISRQAVIKTLLSQALEQSAAESARRRRKTD